MTATTPQGMAKKRDRGEYKRHPYQKLYQTPDWRRRRSEALLCARGLCQIKADGCTRVATTVDHVEPHAGDPVKFKTGKLQAACSNCHYSYKQRLERSGTVIGCEADGKPLDGRWG